MTPSIKLVPSKHTPGQKYKVDLVLNECTCRGFKFRKDCSHLREEKARFNTGLGDSSK